MNLAVKYKPIYDLFNDQLLSVSFHEKVDLADSDHVEIIDGVEISARLEECSAELVVVLLSDNIRIETIVINKLFGRRWGIGFSRLNINGMEFSGEELNDPELLRMNVDQILRMVNRPIKRAIN